MELTFGQKAVGLTFNPSGDPVVNDLKTKAAAFIDACQELRSKAVYVGTQSEVARMASIAITEAQTAQMWAVKAATWKD
jgi:hypothetical protein